jgi:hypothetical protein
VKEIPFEELNGLQVSTDSDHLVAETVLHHIQNAMSGYGRGAYLKGVTHKRPSVHSMEQILGMLGDISQEGFSPAVIYEYFPLQKINSVPVDSTAFRRQLDPNILITFAWEGEEDRSGQARGLVNEIVNVVVGEDTSNPARNGYTNYGASSLVFLLGFEIHCHLPRYRHGPQWTVHFGRAL